MLKDILSQSDFGIKGFKFGCSTPINCKFNTVLSSGLEVVFLLVGFLAFFWFVWGAFQYIFAGGDKEKLAKAKGRITWAIVGLLVTSSAYIIAKFAFNILFPNINQGSLNSGPFGL